MTAPPMIVVLFCDQLRLDLLGCYGGRLVRTPNIDALAAESVVFDRAYTPCALCSPARASLMTGLYPHRHHMFNNSTPGYSYCERLRPDLATVPDWAADHTDYETAYFGKWHIGPAQDLFNSRFHTTHPRPNEDDLPFLSNSHWHPSTSLGPLVRSYARGKAGTIGVPMSRFPDVAAANYTKRFLRSRRPTGRPGLVFCAFPGPHSPWLVPEAFGIRYDPASIPLWPNRHDAFACKPINQKKLRLLQMAHDMNKQPLHGQSLLPFLSGSPEWPRRVHYAEYHGDWYGHYSARMVTDGRWKLVWNLSDYGEFYDLSSDPGELNNLFYESGYRRQRDEYFAMLLAEARRLDDRQVALLSPEVEDQVPRTFDAPL